MRLLVSRPWYSRELEGSYASDFASAAFLFAYTITPRAPSRPPSCTGAWPARSLAPKGADVRVAGVVVDTGVVSEGLASMGVGLSLLVVSYVTCRLGALWQKLRFAMTLYVTSWTGDKLRIAGHGKLMWVVGLTWPLSLCMLVIAAAVGAPLVPVFSLPIFLVGFPRPVRHWPWGIGGQGGQASPSDDSVYYEHAVPRIVKALGPAFVSGSLAGVLPGDHCLVRFQNKLVWIQVLERAHRYVVACVKGLELQETSCHTVEAARVDDIFEYTFGEGSAGETGSGAAQRAAKNPYHADTLQATSQLSLSSYSDARNVLTGIIDSPDNLKAMPSTFLKSLVWTLHRVSEHGGGVRESWKESPLEEYYLEELAKAFPMKWYLHLRQACGKSTTAADVLQHDPVLTLALTCYAAVFTGVGASATPSAADVYAVFGGKLQPGMAARWLKGEGDELMRLVIMSYQHAFKAVYDQTIYGDIESYDELVEYLESYATEWYFGSQGSPGWDACVRANREHLFSLHFDQTTRVYSGRVLSLQPIDAAVGVLNGEGVRALWAAMSVELLYMTNDDEERYSIQAHPTLLRNITIQAAEPPLGYAIYASQPLALQ